jgi:hypothetical protein
MLNALYQKIISCVDWELGSKIEKESYFFGPGNFDYFTTSSSSDHHHHHHHHHHHGRNSFYPQ